MDGEEGVSRASGEAGEKYERSLSLWDGVATTVGVIIGTGIFASPRLVLENSSGNVYLSLLVWFLAGMLALAGGLCFAELGAVIPSSGTMLSMLSMLSTLLPPTCSVF